MWGKFKEHLTDDARYWYKLWSTWFAVLWATAISAFWNDPGVFGSIASFASALPPNIRAALTPVVFFMTGVLPVLVRLLKQVPKNG